MVLPAKRQPPARLLVKSSDITKHATCDKTDTSKQPNIKRRPGLAGKETVHLILPDMIREMIVPSQKPNSYAAIMKESEFERLKNQSKLMTFEERMKIADAIDAKKSQLMKECLARKEEVRQWEKKRVKGIKLKDLEEEAARRAEHLLQRAFELRQEQEDEVKLANRLILGTKCHAIRDAQIAEKKLIQKELQEEERRLEMMMEQQRARALQDEEDRKEKEAARVQEFVRHIREQIRENEVEKILESERIEEESRLVNEAAMQARLEDMEAYQKKLAQQEEIKAELTQINKQLAYFQKLEREEEHIRDLKIQEFMRQKAEREAAREEELRLLQIAKEREIARLRALQERQQDVQAKLDELSAQRTQDEVEREWRRKEQAAAKKKKEEDEALRIAREAQVLDRRRMQALEIAREKREFESIINVQREAAEKEKEEEERRHKNTHAYREALLMQINEKERQRVKQRQEKFAEGLAIKHEQEERERHMREVMLKKVSDLRKYKVPDVYVKEIERQLNLVDK